MDVLHRMYCVSKGFRFYVQNMVNLKHIFPKKFFSYVWSIHLIVKTKFAQIAALFKLFTY